jgi:methylglutaconyl-CoA hydratase
MALANMLHVLYSMNKPTIARVHGAAYAGGMGLLAACDMAVATQDTEFCLSEVKLGLTPATISPHVIGAMGERAARRYFLTAEPFSAAEAYRIGLVQELSMPEQIDGTINEMLGHLVQGGPSAHAAAKDLIRSVARARIDPELMADTARRIADIRVSDEGQEGLGAFLEKRKPAWRESASSAKAKKPAKKSK